MPPLRGRSALAQRYVVAVVLILVTLLTLIMKGPDMETLRDYTQLDRNFRTSGWVSQQQFIRRALKDDMYKKPYDGSAVRKLCSNISWREDVVFSCDEIAGGIGNLKMRLLGCTRFAIEAGALLIHPVIHPRTAFETMDTSFEWDVNLPLDYAFDSAHYYKTLAADCPQLRFVNESDPHPVIPPKSESLRGAPNDLTATFIGHHIENPADWRPNLDRWIVTHILVPNPGLIHDAAHPIRIRLNEFVQFTWPTDYDGMDFRNDWGHIARHPRYIRELSMRLLYRLYDRLQCWPQDPATVSHGCFLGVHIRTEADATSQGWESYETQVQYARDSLKDYQLPALYVATGTPSDFDRLRKDLADVTVAGPNGTQAELQVLQKWDLLDDEDAMLMDTLTWDQMALVDLDIMLRASRFQGIWESSWTWTIALKRHEHAVQEENPYSQGTTFEDGLSRIFGPSNVMASIPLTIYL